MGKETKLKKDGKKAEQSSDKRNDKGQEEDKRRAVFEQTDAERGVVLDRVWAMQFPPLQSCPRTTGLWPLHWSVALND